MLELKIEADAYLVQALTSLPDFTGTDLPHSVGALLALAFERGFAQEHLGELSRRARGLAGPVEGRKHLKGRLRFTAVPRLDRLGLGEESDPSLDDGGAPAGRTPEDR